MQSPRKRVIFATTRGKDTDGMLRALAAWADELVLTRYVENPRGVTIEDLQLTIANLDHVRPEVRSAADPVGAWQARLADRSAERLDLRHRFPVSRRRTARADAGRRGGFECTQLGPVDFPQPQRFPMMGRLPHR